MSIRKARRVKRNRRGSVRRRAIARQGRRKSPNKPRSYKNLGFDTYAEYLRSEYWTQAKQRYQDSKRLQTCLICDSENVQLHHRSYRMLGKEPPRDLVPLCGPCHRECHRFEKITKINLSQAVIAMAADRLNITADQVKAKLKNDA